MASSIWQRALGTIMVLQLLVPVVLAQVNLNLCASFNTADTGRNVSIYQTNGLCSDFCRKQVKAWSITQDQACWCSDYTPSEDSQVGLGRCDIDCPAYPDEKCGGRGLFGYVELIVKLPEGTRGPNDDDDDEATSTTSSSQEATSTTTEETTSSTSTSSSSEEETTSTSMIQTLTSDGEIRTVTVMPTAVPTSEPTSDPEEGNDGGSRNDGGGGLGTGGIVGIVVGVIGGILVIAGAILFWFFKKRKRNNTAAYQEDPSVRGDSSDRMGSSRPDMAMAANGGGGSPTSGVPSNSNRNSTLAIDPRMDPFNQGLYMRNPSHESINTLRDDHDYSRRIQAPKVLRATNPDPDGT